MVDRHNTMIYSYFPLLLLYVKSYCVFLQEIEITEKARREEQEFDELVAFIQQRLSQTEVTR